MLSIEDGNEEIKSILSQSNSRRRQKRTVNVAIGQSTDVFIRVRIFIVSTDEVVQKVPHDLMVAPWAHHEQHYLIGVNYYLKATGEMDRHLSRKRKLIPKCIIMSKRNNACTLWYF